MFNLFKKKKVEIKIGQLWAMGYDENNPFQEYPIIILKIVDYKDGYVKYESNGLYGNSSMTELYLRSFHKLFKECK